MTFHGEDRQALQTLLDNNTIFPEDQLTLTHALKAIQTSIKEYEHFWNFRDELLSDFRHESPEGIHTLKNTIKTLISNCKFTNISTKETLKLMLLAHVVKYHKARVWIRLQDKATLTYQSLLNQCKLLEQRCKQYQKTQMKGRAELTTLTEASSVTSSVH